MMEESMNEHAAKLVEYQYRFFLHDSGLGPLISAISVLDADRSGSGSSDPADLLSLPQFDIDSLSRASQDLDDFLPSALMDAKENLKQMRSTKLAADITEEAAERFCEDFEAVEGRIVACDETSEATDLNGDDKGEGERVKLRDVFPRTAAEIRVLLS